MPGSSHHHDSTQPHHPEGVGHDPASEHPGAGETASGAGSGRFLQPSLRWDAFKQGRFDWRVLVRSPETVYVGLIALAFAVVVSVIMLAAHAHPMLAVRQIATQTRAARVPFEVIDRAATDSDRQAARLRASHVYIADVALLDEILASLEGLPKSLSSAETIESVSPVLREQFGLKDRPERLAAVKSQLKDGEIIPEWLAMVGKLALAMQATPILPDDQFQVEFQSGNPSVELRVGNTLPTEILKRDALVSVKAAGQFEQRMRLLASAAGFRDELLGAVVSRLMWQPKPTFTVDVTATAEKQTLAAAQVVDRKNSYAVGQVLVLRGDRATQDTVELVEAENKAFRRLLGEEHPLRLVVSDMGLIAAALFAAVAMLGYTRSFVPRIARNPGRYGVLCGLLVLALLTTCWTAVQEPWLLVMAVTTPTLFATMIIAVAYERRTAVAFGALLALCGAIALEQPIAVAAMAFMGAGCVCWQLRDLRHRNSLVRAGAVTALVMLVGCALLSLLFRPAVEAAVKQILWDAGTAAAGALLSAFVVLGVLPWVERVFNVTTGMTLVELRDPKQPLLRELQQRAPGTYNHSLNVAALAEAAADAIGADSLLTYAGALYHDVGKMNKPEYFAENQVGGLNRHEKLAPAMSLLVIVGHVKDGIELAREYHLPKVLHHFIEAHHGTTLVEYFYHRARKAASAANIAGEHMPQEIEYRYPGPKPRTREAAILMVCDAAESASRTLADPTPTRLDALVRAIAHRRLMDGQFDQCDLTLGDLNLVIEAVSRVLASIHHQRVVYPESPANTPTPTPTPPPGAGGGSGGGGNGVSSTIEVAGRSAGFVPVSAKAS